MSLLVKNGMLVYESGIVKADLLVENEKITRIGEHIKEDNCDRVIDAVGKLVLPGVIDAHVHYNMKTRFGRTADDFETGSLSAAFGGVTSFIDFAGPIKGKSLLEALKERENEARGHSYLDFSFHMEINGAFEQDLNELPDLKEYGITSLKVYTTYGMQLTDARMLQLFKKAAQEGMLVMVHAEDNDTICRLRKSFISDGKTAYSFHSESRPVIAEVSAIKKILSISKETGCPVYLAHVSSSEGAVAVRTAMTAGQKVYGETCPHYLLLTDQCYFSNEPYKYIMTPPLRKDADRDLLWNSIADGTLQCVSTDHCSFSIKDKISSDSCFETVPGVGGSETLLPLLYSEGVSGGKISLEKLVSLLSANPARMFGLYPQKGTLAAGSDGDIVIFDPDKEVVIKGEELHSVSGYSIFEGFKVKGYPVMTISRGSIICENNRLLAPKPAGRFIRGGGEGDASSQRTHVLDI